MIFEYIINNPWILILLILWTVPWKGVALWTAARREEKWWFAVLLVANTPALLEIFYIFFSGQSGNPFQKFLKSSLKKPYRYDHRDGLCFLRVLAKIKLLWYKYNSCSFESYKITRGALGCQNRCFHQVSASSEKT